MLADIALQGKDTYFDQDHSFDSSRPAGRHRRKTPWKNDNPSTRRTDNKVRRLRRLSPARTLPGDSRREAPRTGLHGPSCCLV
jgi:hypothetical protein